MAKKEPPQEYIEVLEVLNVLYDEVDGCSFYDYIFPDNQKQGEQCSHYEKPNAVYLYTDEKDSGTRPGPAWHASPPCWIPGPTWRTGPLPPLWPGPAARRWSLTT